MMLMRAKTVVPYGCICDRSTEVIRSKNAGRPLRRAFIRPQKDPMLLPVYNFILSYLAVISGNAPDGRKVYNVVWRF